MWWNSGPGPGAGMGWGGWVLIAVLMIVFWAAVIAGLVALFRGVSTTDRRPDRAAADQNHARRILDERFARGEVGVDEYCRRANELGSRH